MLKLGFAVESLTEVFLLCGIQLVKCLPQKRIIELTDPLTRGNRRIIFQLKCSNFYK